ncbi:MAG: hypothetical protein U0798_06400 [Gemmataceae bacterium]
MDERLLVFSTVDYKVGTAAATAVAGTLVLGNLFDNPIDAYRGVRRSRRTAVWRNT